MKAWLQDFPTTNAGAVVAILLIILTGLIVCVRLALGLKFPDGYDGWLALLGALAGVSAIGVIGKRFTDPQYRQSGMPSVNVEKADTVTTTKGPI